VEPVKTDEYLNDGDILPIAGGIEVIHTPGHCAGHIALLLKGEDTLIAGDICSNMSGLGLSIAYEDPELGLKSIFKASKHDFDKAVFGHGKAVMQDAAVKMRKKFTPKMK
jgi:glyoxylase-like metal-dependent hydrolase (beta-lactamase superfamily II)